MNWQKAKDGRTVRRSEALLRGEQGKQRHSEGGALTDRCLLVMSHMQMDGDTVRLKYKLIDADCVEVCRYAWARWHGVSKSAIKKGEKLARESFN